MSRLVFAQAEVQYEDKRFESEEWAQFKPNTPTGMLPMLEVDGKQLVGSVVICRFLAERFGLAGSNDVENAEIAGILDVTSDFLQRMSKWFYEKDEEKKAEILKKIQEEDIPKYWGILEGMCKKNASEEGWIYGKKPTYADFAIYCFLDYVLPMAPDFKEKFPLITKLRGAVEALPNIAKWLEKRPKTER